MNALLLILEHSKQTKCYLDVDVSEERTYRIFNKILSNIAYYYAVDDILMYN